MCAWLSIVASLACGRESPQRADSAESVPPGTIRHSTLTPLLWPDKTAGLRFFRLDQFVGGDAGRLACDSTGIFERHDDGSVRLQTRSRFCEHV